MCLFVPLGMKGLWELNLCETKTGPQKMKTSKDFERADLYYIYLFIYGLYFTHIK